VADLNGLTCSFPGGATGTIKVSTDSSGVVTLTCQSTSCTHFTGLTAGGNPINYVDCNEPLGTPGDPTTYSQTMAVDAATGARDGIPFVGTEDTDTTQSCGGYPVVVLQQLKSGPSGINLLNQITWAYAGPNAGHVVASGSSALACPASTDPTWN